MSFSISLSLLLAFSISGSADRPFAPSSLNPVVTLAQGTSEDDARGDRLLEQGRQQFNNSQFREAAATWERALTVYRADGDRRGELQAVGFLGMIYPYFGEYRKALEFADRQLALARELGDRQGEANAWGNFSVIYIYLGDFPRAIEVSEQLLELSRELDDPAGERSAIGNLGLIYLSRSQYGKAIEYIHQSLEMSREDGNKLNQSNGLGNLGVAYRAIGNYDRAIEYTEAQLEIAREIGNRQQEANALGNLGIIYIYKQQYNSAIEYNERQLAIAREIGDPRGAKNALGNIGIVYFLREDYGGAIARFNEVLTLTRQIGDRTGEANSLGNLAQAHLRSANYSEATNYAREQLALVRELGDRRAEANALMSVGGALLYDGRSQEAIPLLRQGIEVFESLVPGVSNENKITLLDTFGDSYDLLQQALVLVGRAEEALEVSERGRARAFVELLAQRRNPNSTAEIELDPPTIADITQVARDRQATLVEYSIVDAGLLIWVVTPEGNVHLRTVKFSPQQLQNLAEQGRVSAAGGVILNENEIAFANAVRGTRAALNFNQSAAQEQANDVEEIEEEREKLKELYNLLIKPIEDLLPDHPDARIVFIPDAALFLVPFPALIDDRDRYLIERYTLLSAPSIQVLQLTERRSPPSSSESGEGEFLVVGNPKMPPVYSPERNQLEPLRALPYAQAEAIEIAKIVKTLALVGEKATEALLKQRMTQARVIHLATHGLIDDRHAMDSAIAVTPDGDNDGLLTAEEIFELDLKADLVVLSACETGLGEITGDGVVGLSRSFLSAGSRSVLVSLWSVRDDSTAFLMREFYREFDRTGDKAHALRQAMLVTMDREQYAHPFHWAAFTLIGAAD
ncbi:CHAT domain-containing protein [Oxynema sp. CENA135]|uniref:CHAT domain-containing protein n=1 Tax=Oxynema sp. CENA135 TaxID=984206 RepID=UPI00190AB6A1|nr:CHAT domain-containing tetratricopeptide repeat protein [Oxynema sp. CENA135]MBK4728291.1 CHAT domain-containing protein [Oxynema sp. CENA135]